MQVIIHIGLHKTATRFLDHEVFRPLRARGVVYNPPEIMQHLRGAMEGDADAVARVRQATADLAAAGTPKLLLSRPGISGDMFDNHADYRDKRDAIKALFPEARIVLFVRHPPDWLVSAYRQSLVKGAGGPIETFLNFYRGAFREKPAHHVRGMRNLEALQLRFLAIHDAYVEAYGAEGVYLFRQEDLRDRPREVRALMERCLGQDLPSPSGGRTRNRGFSALAIWLFCGGWRRPSRPTRVRAGRPPLFVRRYLQRPVRRLRAVFVRHVFDRIAYVDWDLLARGGMREQLERHYADESRALARVAAAGLERVSAGADTPEARTTGTSA